MLVFRTSPGSLYTLTHTEKIKSSEDSVLKSGSRLQLSQGTLELNFESGVKSIVMAPADLTVNSDSSISLSKGTAWFQVPAGAEGFTVETSDLQVVDLGTEFGIIAQSNQRDQVHVFKGKVQASSLKQRKGSSIISSGEAREVNVIGRLESISPKPNAFLTSLPDTLPHLHWSFDGDDPFQPTGSVAQTNDIIVQPIQSDSRPASDRLIRGVNGKALFFDGKGDRIRTNWAGILGDEPRTVACWIKAGDDGDFDWEPIVEWGKVSSAPDNSYWRFIAAKSETHADRLILRLAVGDSWYDGQKNLADGDWHHVAVVDTGKLNQLGDPDFKFYIDGKREPAHHNERSKILKSRYTQEQFPLTVGFRRLETDIPEHHLLHGSIDELFIFQGVLSRSHLERVMNSSKP